MKVALLTNIVSPHQLPLAEAIVRRIGAENYRYAYTEPFHEERAKMGWGDGRAPEWCRPANECHDFLENADLVYSELRDFDLFERRLEENKKIQSDWSINLKNRYYYHHLSKKKGYILH